MTDQTFETRLAIVVNAIEKRLSVTPSDYTLPLKIDLSRTPPGPVTMVAGGDTFIADLHLLREGGPEMALIKPLGGLVTYEEELFNELDKKLSTIPIAYGNLTSSELILRVLPEYKAIAIKSGSALWKISI